MDSLPTLLASGRRRMSRVLGVAALRCADQDIPQEKPMAAMRRGSMKVRLKPDAAVEMYDLAADRGEANLAAKMPEVAAKMESS
jgi:hypothetical protein